MTTEAKTLHTIHDLYTDYFLNELGRVELYVVDAGTQVINGRYIETITRKVIAVEGEYGEVKFFVSYKGKKYPVQEKLRGVCCGYDLAIELGTEEKPSTMLVYDFTL